MPKLIIFDNKKCEQCGVFFNRKHLSSGRLEAAADYRARKFCSKSCYFAFNTGEEHWYWRGGLKRRPDGCIRCSATDEYLHRVVMEKKLGRRLLPTEHVHHIDGDKSNNDPSNLALTTNSEHRKEHCKTQPRDGKSGRFV